VTALLAEARRAPHVLGVTSPYSRATAYQISRDGTIAYADVELDDRASVIPMSVGRDFIHLADKYDSDAVTVEAGGPVVEFAEQEQGSASEMIGILAAIIILIVAFGSLLAMGLPIVTALFGILIGLSIVVLLGHVVKVPSFAAQVAAMIGIGVGIDYALFIVTRFRTALSHGKEPEDAVEEALGTAGRAVLFAGTVVVIALLSLITMRFIVVRGVALSGASVVLITMAAAVTLLPALLGFAGRGIDRFHVPFLHHAADARSARRSFWFAWSRFVQRRPLPIFLVGLVIVSALAVPLLKMRVGTADAGNTPTERTSRRAYDDLAKGFGPGFNAPLLVVVDTSKRGSDHGTVEALRAAIRHTEGVAFASAPRYNPADDTAIITVFPTTAPQDPGTDDIVLRLRHHTIPGLLRDTDVVASVGGLTASFVDFGDQISARLPIFIGVVIVLSFILLTVVFRSILVALKAAIMNLLSIGAAYGVMVAIFEWGWGANLIGVGRSGPIEAWVPMMMFAVLFGLSMDYEVFMLSRIREEYVHTHDNGLAVADGLASTARVITAAAAIMIAVFLSFVLGSERVLKMVGIGLATAIFVDATLVRLVLVPSTMELLGDRNWWLPKWLDRILPELHLEGAEREEHARPALEPIAGD
jgi:RND superfamily putative drug exporter